MTTIGDILDVKGRDVWSIAPNKTVFDALTLMGEKNIGALPVTVRDELVGIISERDYARKVILKGKTSRNTQIQEIMTASVVCTQLDQTVQECMEVMTDKHFRHLPVLDGDQLVGIVSIGDLVKSIISDQQFMIEQLENYITQ